MRDTPGSRQVAVISETFARKYFKNENPQGRHFGLGDPKHSLDYEIVGVVQDAKWREPSEPADPMFFLPLHMSVESIMPIVPTGEYAWITEQHRSFDPADAPTWQYLDRLVDRPRQHCD